MALRISSSMLSHSQGNILWRTQLSQAATKSNTEFLQMLSFSMTGLWLCYCDSITTERKKILYHEILFMLESWLWILCFILHHTSLNLIVHVLPKWRDFFLARTHLIPSEDCTHLIPIHNQKRNNWSDKRKCTRLKALSSVNLISQKYTS